MATEVHAPAGADMDAQFQNAFADGFAIAEIARFELADADANPCLDHFVPQSTEPLCERLMAVLATVPKNLHHRRGCSLKATQALSGHPPDSFRKRSNDCSRLGAVAQVRLRGA